MEKINNGTELKTLVAAAALANARTFGGQDYIGYPHLHGPGPALAMAAGAARADRARCRCSRCCTATPAGFKPWAAARTKCCTRSSRPSCRQDAGRSVLQEATRSADLAPAERTFAALAKGDAGEAYNHLQYAVEDEIDVHRVVLSWRAWSTLELTGKQHAHTLLRQSVRYCVDTEQSPQEPQPGRLADPRTAAQAARPVQAH